MELKLEPHHRHVFMEFFSCPLFFGSHGTRKPYFKTPYICPLRLLSNLSPLCYFIQLCKIFAVESRIICKNLYIFCYCCWAQNWRLSFHLFKAKKLYRIFKFARHRGEGGGGIPNPIRLQYAILIFCDGSFCHTFFPVGFRVNFFSKTILFLNDRRTHSPLSKRNVLTFLKFAHLHQF